MTKEKSVKTQARRLRC